LLCHKHSVIARKLRVRLAWLISIGWAILGAVRARSAVAAATRAIESLKAHTIVGAIGIETVGVHITAAVTAIGVLELALQLVDSAVRASPTRITDTGVVVGAIVHALLRVVGITWVWVAVVVVGARVAIATVPRHAATVKRPGRVDAFGVWVAVMRVRVAFVDIKVAERVGPTFVTQAAECIGTIVSAGAILARRSCTVVGLHTTITPDTIADETILAAAAVGALGVHTGAPVFRGGTSVGERLAFIDIVLALGAVPTLIAVAPIVKDTEVDTRAILAAGATFHTHYAVVDVIARVHAVATVPRLASAQVRSRCVGAVSVLVACIDATATLVNVQVAVLVVPPGIASAHVHARHCRTAFIGSDVLAFAMFVECALDWIPRATWRYNLGVICAHSGTRLIAVIVAVA
jgi:hypothetical protein